MSRYPSVLSTGGSTSSLANGNVPNSILPSMSSSQSFRKLSISKLSSSEDLDPDELFTKYTINEVKSVQYQLRADADAKQEELRLMVGERYRDLLQASTSIISIACSSKRVLAALEESNDAIKAQKVPPLPQSTINHGTQDTHLHTLQLLSAHIKLLLDAPEHLWRLIERKKYFTAAWLFLLSRVVHLALRQDEDEETWSSQGIDVLDQFPLIQRQWDAVSQFRSQIVHKATLSLREPSVTTIDVCSTSLTLHLLDSKPLSETLVVFLEQRSRSLKMLLSYGLDTPRKSPVSPSMKRANGHAPHKLEPRKPTARQIKDAVQAVLDAVISTTKASRDVYGSSATSSSLVESVLEYVDGESSTESSASPQLPTELQLTTESLLATLPSSTHFMLLPQNLKSYKPCVDLSSASSRVTQLDLERKVTEWFQNATDSLKIALDRWFSDLTSVKDVWNTRHALRKWVTSSDSIHAQETKDLTTLLDNASRKRIIEIWQSTLLDAELKFGTSMEKAVASIREPVDTRIDALPLQNIFQAPQLPAAASVGPVDAPFQKYKTSLRRQLLGRTALLDDVLKTLEACARSLQNDILQVVSPFDDDTRTVAGDLKESYGPNALTLCSNVLRKLEDISDGVPDITHTDMNSLVFVSRVAQEFTSTSCFVDHLCVTTSVVEDFNDKSRILHDKIIDRWRSYTVSSIVNTYYPTAAATFDLDSPNAYTPSWNLTNAIISLSYGVQQLGLARNVARQARIVEGTLRLFVIQLIESKGLLSYPQQVLYDLALLIQLVGTYEGEEWGNIRQCIEEKMAVIRAKVEHAVPPELATNAADYLRRVQVLYGPLLEGIFPPAPRPREKGSALLPLGPPATDQLEFQLAMEVAKPVVRRFNMLLVG